MVNDATAFPMMMPATDSQSARVPLQYAHYRTHRIVMQQYFMGVLKPRPSQVSISKLLSNHQTGALLFKALNAIWHVYYHSYTAKEHLTSWKVMQQSHAFMCCRMRCCKSCGASSRKLTVRVLGLAPQYCRHAARQTIRHVHGGGRM